MSGLSLLPGAAAELLCQTVRGSLTYQAVSSPRMSKEVSVSSKGNPKIMLRSSSDIHTS